MLYDILKIMRTESTKLESLTWKPKKTENAVEMKVHKNKSVTCWEELHKHVESVQKSCLKQTACLFGHKEPTYLPMQCQQQFQQEDLPHTTQTLPRNPFPFSEPLQMLHNRSRWQSAIHQITHKLPVLSGLSSITVKLVSYQFFNWCIKLPIS